MDDPPERPPALTVVQGISSALNNSWKYDEKNLLGCTRR